MSAPLDHVSRRYDRICEPGGSPHIVCQLWPECGCDKDCADLTDARMVRRLLIAFIAATVAIGVCLLIA